MTKFNNQIILLSTLLLLCSCNTEVTVKDDSGELNTMTTDDYLNTVVEAYLYGYPLLLMQYTKELGTNIAEPHPTIPLAPINQLGHYRRFADHTSRRVVKPNVDTYYSIAWFDLSQGPQVLTMPHTDRYYLLPFYDAFTNVIASPGTRTHGDKALTLLIIGPDYHGEDIDGMMTIRSPTDVAWLIGRIETYDDIDGNTVVRSIQNRMDLRPLAALGDSTYKAPKGQQIDLVDDLPPVKKIESLSIEDYMNQLNSLLPEESSASYDKDILLSLSRIGISRGLHFELPTDNFVLGQKLKAIPKVIHERMRERKANSEPTLMKNNWTMITSKLGDYGKDYLMRSYVSFIGLGANLAEDAIYPFTTVDANGNPLIGSQDYRIHMPPNELPPVKAFWSLTAYNDDDFLIENEANKFAINSKDSLVYNDNGSLDLYIQAERPDSVSINNWVPINPNEGFSLTMRLYWPDDQVFDGDWIPPLVIPIQ